MDPILLAAITQGAIKGMQWAYEAAQLSQRYQAGEVTTEEAKDIWRRMQPGFIAGDQAWEQAGEPKKETA